MDRIRYNTANYPSESTNGVRFASSSSQPNYSSKAVQDALRHLASIDLIDLCNEAKVERCRASRDLRSCGCLVESVLNSCGHASLCAECIQRCENCPICRTSLPKNGNILRPRLYYECVEAGLISKDCNVRFQEKEDGETHLTADVQRLYSLFDVAMENNLCCLISHYVTDVCMDESAVSSDPVIAFLLDEVVVKDWCKRAFKNIIEQVQGIYNLEITEMKTKMDALLKVLAKLVGLSSVLEVLNLSFKDTHSAKLDDLNRLQESILKTKQHMDMMLWCIRHQFLENVRSRHDNVFTWRSVVRERKSAAVERAWPEAVELYGESTGQDNSSLFIEDALLNLEVDKGDEQASAIELEVASLQRDGGSSFFRSKIEGLGGSYPFENVRAAIDTLFLCGGSDMVVAKRAILLYYLFDRHWMMADEEWRHVVDDFAATFSITRHSLLESFAFYLLDDHTDEALQEACHLLPEIAGPESHPKIAKVLLERKAPDSALMFLRWCGRDGGAEISLSEAVTAIRVRVECGLLTEAFMYQRMLCIKVKEKQLNHKLPVDALDESEGEVRSWTDWVLVLVTEICYLCVRRNIIDRVIELPWNDDEERHLHKCLLDCAIVNPLATAGSLLVVFYLQRHRYIDAYHTNKELQLVEEDLFSKNSVDEEGLYRMRSSADWRSGLVNKAVELLPEVEQQLLKAGKLPEDMALCVDRADCQREADVGRVLEEAGSMPSASSSLCSSLILQMEHDPSFKSSRFPILKPAGHVGVTEPEFQNLASPSTSHGNFFMDSEKSSKPPFSMVKNYKLDDVLTSGIRSMKASAVKDCNRASSRLFNGEFQDAQLDEVSSPVEQNGLFGSLSKVSPPHSRRVMAKPTRTPSSNRGLLDDSPEERFKTASGKRFLPRDLDRPGNTASLGDAMDISWSREAYSSPAADFNTSAQRWRSDETSDEEEQQSPEKLRVVSSRLTTKKRSSIRGRLSRR
ncbi:E3 ubiquitin-protein ligase HOS1-like isoform X1 [Chenopodium quinoa]|uniref:RING-type domain-containing protein n=1 Tax=Chenopodium quinoa TaxID=63459 RepID=A0A803L5H9_CHEQI|nr:E3 ubiquitin-protein ligase HOS1-like isoform X1 [Chenopodium quinoa]